MRFLTFRDSQGPYLGVLHGEAVIDLHAMSAAQGVMLPNDMIGLIEMGEDGLRVTRRLLDLPDAREYARPLSSVEVLSPLNPPRANVLAIGRNYMEHARESARVQSEEVMRPTVFSKAQTSVTGPYSDVPLNPSISSDLDWEAELGVVIGRRGINIPRDQALQYVFGYTVVNDISARDIQYGWGGQFFKGKSLDGSCPVGPWIVTADEVPDPQSLRVTLRLNGETKQDANTSDMIFPVAEIVAQLSVGMTLLPGNLIATGTPAGVGHARTPPEFLRDGDVMETEIEGIGVLRNRIVQVN